MFITPVFYAYLASDAIKGRVQRCHPSDAALIVAAITNSVQDQQ
jgi:hypothetical protein